MRVGFDGGGYETRPGVTARRDFSRAPAAVDRGDPGEAGQTARATDDGQAGSLQPGATRPDGKKLSPEDQAQVTELRRRDAEVRAHEAAHQAAAGAAGGGASFTYTTGPDGRQYAVGGEVPVQIRSGRTPEETMRNAARVRAAALAPADPSAQDRAVAAEAAAMEAAARAELLQHPTGAADGGPREPTLSAGNGEKAQEVGAESVPPSDLEQSLLALQNEQRPAGSGWRHLHSPDGCAGCAIRVAAYR